MSAEKPPVDVELTWDGELRFDASAGDVRMRLDSESQAGPSPMQALACALAGCMAMDVVDILQKGRQPLEGLRARLSGRRAEDPPRRFVTIDLTFVVSGAVNANHIERAINLSLDKYCSVWQSMRQDIAFRVDFHLEPSGN